LEQERVDNIKNRINEFHSEWSQRISQLQFSEIEEFEEKFTATVADYDTKSLAEFEVLFSDSWSQLTYALSERKSVLLDQEQIRIQQIELAKEKERQRLEAERIAEEQRKEREKLEAEQKAEAEKIRLAKEAFEKEKREFEEKQAEAKFQERCKQLTEIGFVLNERNEAYQKGLNYLNVEDIKLASNDLWERELEDAKNAKDFSEMETVNTDTQEVEFEEVKSEQYANENQEEDTHEEATKGLSTRLKANTLASKNDLAPSLRLTWEEIHDAFTEETEIDDSINFYYWLKDNFNVPTYKI